MVLMIIIGVVAVTNVAFILSACKLNNPYARKEDTDYVMKYCMKNSKGK